MPFGYTGQMNAPEKKIDRLNAMMRAGDWNRAIKFAATFPRLGSERDAILTASSALLSPRMYEGMGRSVADLVNAGREALVSRYGHRLT